MLSHVIIFLVIVSCAVQHSSTVRTLSDSSDILTLSSTNGMKSSTNGLKSPTTGFKHCLVKDSSSHSEDQSTLCLQQENADTRFFTEYCEGIGFAIKPGTCADEGFTENNAPPGYASAEAVESFRKDGLQFMTRPVKNCLIKEHAEATEAQATMCLHQFHNEPNFLIEYCSQYGFAITDGTCHSVGFTVPNPVPKDTKPAALQVMADGRWHFMTRPVKHCLGKEHAEATEAQATVCLHQFHDEPKFLREYCSEYGFAITDGSCNSVGFTVPNPVPKDTKPADLQVMADGRWKFMRRE